MKKLFISAGPVLSSLAFAPQVFAQNEVDVSPCPPPGSPFRPLCEMSGQNLGQIIGFIITIAFIIAILIALGFLVWGGIKWITSGGDKAGVEGARNQIIAAIIGLIIVFLSFFILNLVLSLFNLSIFNLTLPTFPGIQ